MRHLALALAAVAGLALAAPLSADAATVRVAQTTAVMNHGAPVVMKKSVRHHSAMRHGCRTVIVKKAPWSSCCRNQGASLPLNGATDYKGPALRGLFSCTRNLFAACAFLRRG